MANCIRTVLLKALLIRRWRKKIKRKQRCCNIRPIFFKRFQYGESKLVRELREDPFYHHSYFRMSQETFDELFMKIQHSLIEGKTHCRPISKLEKLAVTLRYLATGNTQISLSMNYRISPSAIGALLRETMTVICNELESEYLPVPTREDWTLIEKDFSEEWNFPNCCGAIDGKHIRVRVPNLSGSMNFNYKGFFSIVLLAVIDAKYRFVLVDIGASGSQSDGGVLSRSSIGKAMDDNNLNLPDDKMVGSNLLPYVIVGDDAFPLQKNLLKPYPGRGLTFARRIFNYRLSRARMVSENGFGILSARWRILHTAINGDPNFVKLIVKTCVLLHNFLLKKKDMCNITADMSANGGIVNGNWRDVACVNLLNVRGQGSNNHSFSASTIRDKFMSYLNGEGAVEWQRRML